MARRSGLHPFSEKVAFILGGAAVALCLAWLIWARSRAPSPEALAGQTEVAFAPVDAARPLTTGARVPTHMPLVVRARNQLPRPIHAVAFALDGTGQVHWYVPARSAGASEVVPTGDAERELHAADRRLPVGPVRLVTARAIAPIDPRAVEARIADWWQTEGDLSRGASLGVGDLERSIWIEIVEQ